MSSSTESQERAERLFADFLSLRDADPSADFERFVAAYPGDAELLRAHHADWLRLAPVLGAIGLGDGSVAPRGDGGAPARYEVGGEVGRGGMGLVLEVWDRELERHVGMKRLRDAGPGAGERRELRFLREARLTAQLDHPGVVPVHELGEDAAGRPFFTMQLVRGRDLGEVFELAREEREGWSTTRVLTELLKACQAVAYAHEQGVVHRDLKPSNVRIGRFGEVYVMDWGLARRVDEREDARGDGGRRADDEPSDEATLTRAGDTVGTPAYMAPEQASGGARSAGPAADVYALGAILYELLAGHRPYDDGGELGASEVVERLRAGPPAPIERAAPSAPPELVAICAKAMERDPAQRYASVVALAEDLAAYLEGRVVRTHRTGAWVELSKWVARNRAFAAALVAAALFLVVGLGVSWSLYRREQRRADEVLGLSAIQDLRSLEARARELWPAAPERAEDYRAWLDDARLLVASRDRHAASLAELRRSGSAGDRGRRWWEAQLAALVAELERFSDPDVGLVAGTSAEFGWGIERRLAFAERLEARSAGSAPWPADLVPLGDDPRSGLPELAHLASGAIPTRDPATGELVLAEDSALVLVLVPGGAFTMGSQASDRSGPGYDPDSNPDERPPRVVELDEFFIAKHELTQSQWLRLAGANPSDYRPGSRVAEHVVTGRHPVEQVSWTRASEVLARFGLELPTEAQWEYAARAGTDEPWCTGPDAASLEGAANLADDYSRRMGAPSGYGYEPWDDGWLIHAPVGSFRPNAFGLHDVHGNVWEWCRDVVAPYDAEPRRGDGRRFAEGVRNRIYRGGSFNYRASSARAALRDNSPPDAKSSWIGVRPVRRLR